MVTMLDCINRVPSIIEGILANKDVYYKQLREVLAKDIQKYNAVYFLGSGSSNTANIASARFVEKVTGLETVTFIPNDFLSKTAYNPNGIYVFVSQTGTSTLMKEALLNMKAKGYRTIATTEKLDTPIGELADIYVDMGCGYEEYWMRTIGHCASVVTDMLIGMEIGLLNGHLSQEEYDALIADLKKVPASHKSVSKKTMEWLDRNIDLIGQGDEVVYYGPNALWGTALEGALKLLETAKTQFAIGYEMDDGLHGPVLGFTKRQMVIILNDGKQNETIAQGLAKMMKTEFGHGFIVGKNPQDELDLPFEPASENFMALEFAPFVQIMAYRMALHFGTPVLPVETMVDNTVKYFVTHKEEK